MDNTFDVKTPMHMRLTGTARYYLTEMARRKGLSQTAVMELAVRLMAQHEGIPNPESKEKEGTLQGGSVNA